VNGSHFLLTFQCRSRQHRFRAPENPSVVSSHHPPTPSMSSFGVECRVDRTSASASRGADRRRRHHRSIVTNKPSTSVAARRPPPAPQSAAQVAGAAHAVCGSISHAHHSPRAPLGQSERGHRTSPRRKLFDLIAVALDPLARAGRRRHHRHPPLARARVVRE
jgi:hypothetical protein